MNNFMNTRKSAILGFVAVAFMSIFYMTSFRASEAEGNTHLILVEIYETPGWEGKGVIVHQGDGKIDHYPFKEFTRENHDDNGELILNTINNLEDKGYDIEHMTSGLAESGMITKIFMRKVLH